MQYTPLIPLVVEEDQWLPKLYKNDNNNNNNYNNNDDNNNQRGLMSNLLEQF